MGIRLTGQRLDLPADRRQVHINTAGHRGRNVLRSGLLHYLRVRSTYLTLTEDVLALRSLLELFVLLSGVKPSVDHCSAGVERF